MMPVDEGHIRVIVVLVVSMFASVAYFLLEVILHSPETVRKMPLWVVVALLVSISIVGGVVGATVYAGVTEYMPELGEWLRVGIGACSSMIGKDLIVYYRNRIKKEVMK